ncbi:MAG TPA: WcaF family extracellular polysaccharide biosynthesis acetyltransferase [Steroidobacteraceae bacterium]|nr:WcaF family extracellular polysaccharide biosynthesis acetyltransferase [Steroidobacteraceae bacterium]
MPAKVQDLARFRVPAGFRGRPQWFVQLWWLVQSTLFGLSPDALYGWRSFLLRLFGAGIGKGVRIRASARVTYPWKVRIGDRTWIGHHSVLYSLGNISIGEDVAIAHDVYLCAGGHDYRQVDFPYLTKPSEIDIAIGSEVWLANDVFVGPGVHVGAGAVVGVRSTVLRSLPEGMVCHGTPAVPVKPRLREQEKREWHAGS